MISPHQHFPYPSIRVSPARQVFDKMPERPFNTFLNRSLGKFPQLLIYAVLEWIMIVLFANGLLTFISNEFAKCFGLKIPCLLCTRIDHLLVKRNSGFCYDSICENHKKGISSLAYCQAHRNLSDIHCMCQSCLLSTENNDQKLKEKAEKKDAKVENDEISGCSCCGETLKPKSSSRLVRSTSISYAPNPALASISAPVPSPSPRASFLMSRNEDVRNIDSPRVRYLEAKQILDSKSEVMEYDASNVDNQGKEDVKAPMASIGQDPKDTNDDSNRTPRFARGNKLLGVPLNSAPASPKWVNRGMNSRKISVDRGELTTEPTDASSLTEAENDILNRLGKQNRLDHNSVMELYMELDEERNASDIAANNAMAMITRLQAEKASIQTEALQYQRMMEEQMEYDEEAFQALKDTLDKRDEDVMNLESELEMYRDKYGVIQKEGSEFFDDEYQERKSQSLPSFGENSGTASLNGDDHNERDRKESGIENQEESSLDFEGERSHLLSLLTDLEKRLYADDGRWKSPELEMIKHEDDEGTGDCTKATIMSEVSSIKERLRAVEADSGFLKHAAITLQKGSEGTKLLSEIAQHLQKIRQSINPPSDNVEA